MTERVYNGYPVTAQQKCLAHLRRHFKKVVKLGHGNNPVLGQAFKDLIDEAFTQHRHWREIQDKAVYRSWAEGFKVRIQDILHKWLGLAGYYSGNLLRSRSRQSRPVVVLSRATQKSHQITTWRSVRNANAVTKRLCQWGFPFDDEVCSDGRPALVWCRLVADRDGRSLSFLNKP